VDVHKESWHVTARTEERKFPWGIPSQYHACKTFLVIQGLQDQVAYEQVPAVSGYMTDLLKTE